MIKKRFAVLSALVLLFFACKQSPIFYDISLEVEPIDPRIKGKPTNIAQIDSSLYVASRFGSTVYEYYDEAWHTLSESPSKIIELAATDGALYALTGTPGSLGLKKLPKNSQTWTSIDTEGKNVQTIYGAGDYLFAGTIDDFSTQPPTCSILYVKDDGASLTLLKSGTSLLKGAAYAGNTYYLATNGSGILTTTDTPVPTSPSLVTTSNPDVATFTSDVPTFALDVTTFASDVVTFTSDVITSASTVTTFASDVTTSNPDVTTFASDVATSAGELQPPKAAVFPGIQEPQKPQPDIMGIINVGGKIVAVSRDGYIIYGNVNGFTEIKMSDVSYFSGALATWKQDSDTHLLLLGIQGGVSSTAHGYREIPLTADGTLDTGNMPLQKPGEKEISSVDDYEQYVVTIGKHPLSSIIQAPDGILFAATTQHGLWSYRYRDNKGKHIWNAED